MSTDGNLTRVGERKKKHMCLNDSMGYQGRNISIPRALVPRWTLSLSLWDVYVGENPILQKCRWLKRFS
jgi:hypothetical protein